MKKSGRMIMITALVLGLGISELPARQIHADESMGEAASGSAAQVEVSQANPLGTVTVTGAKKDTSLKKVTLTWSSAAEAQGYVIQRKTGKGNFAEIARVTDAAPGNKTYVDSKVQPGVTYTYQVCPWRILADGTIETGSCAKAVSVSLVPGKVKGLKAKKGRGRITVTWKKTAGATGYQVYTKVFVKGIKMKYSRAKTQKSRKYKRGMLVRGMKYGFKVRAYKKVNGKKIYGPFTTVTKRY